MTYNRPRGAPFGALLLITIGVVLLLQTLDIAPWGLWANLLTLWPALLILLGINLILRGANPAYATLVVAAGMAVTVAAAWAGTPRWGDVETTTYALDLQSLQSASVDIEHGAGILELNALPAGSPQLVNATFTDVPESVHTSFSERNGAGELRIRSNLRRFFDFAFGGRRTWEVGLSRDIPLEIRMQSGASDLRIDLSDLRVTDLDIGTGASNLTLILPAAAGHVQASVSAGAASMEITVPEDVAAEIHSEGGLTSVNVDTARFPRTGDVYASPGFDTAENRVTLVIRSGAARVTVN